jgi:hypothetical protein
MPIAIPPRTEVARNVLPTLDSAGVQRSAAQAIIEQLRETIVEELGKTTANGNTEVVAELSAEQLRSIERRVLNEGRAFGGQNLSGASMRAAIAVVADELLQLGYYNIVYQTVDNETVQVLGRNQDQNVDHLRLRFDLAGDKRFDLDLETSSILSMQGPVRNNRQGSAEPISDPAGSAWQAFVNGRKRIIANSNGML